MKKVTKALIPAGGYGTRFLPATKSIPKELFPIGTKPVVLHAVEECVASGIEEIVFVVSHHKQAVENLFSPNQELYDFLEKQGKGEQVKELKRISSLAEFTFVHTRSPYGNGQAILSAEHLLADDPFVVVWADEFMMNPEQPRVKQCLEVFEAYGKPVISAVEITDPAKRSKYGMARLEDFKGNDTVKSIVEIVEKPPAGTEPSSYATHGAYVLTPEIFDHCKKVNCDKEEEVSIVEFINELIKTTGCLAKIIPNITYFDCGNPLEYFHSQIEYALNYSPFKDEARAFIQEKARTLR